MPVTFPDALPYPDDSYGNDLSQHLKDLADATQAKFTDQETWVSWTPTFDLVNRGGFSSLGTGGVALGHYRRTIFGADALIYAEFRFVLGTSPTIQTGLFILELPVTAYSWAGENQNQTIGSWSLRDDSTSSPIQHMGGTIGLFDTSNGLWGHFNSAPDNVSTFSSRFRIDSNDPIPWAVGDNFTGQLLYRAA